MPRKHVCDALDRNDIVFDASSVDWTDIVRCRRGMAVPVAERRKRVLGQACLAAEIDTLLRLLPLPVSTLLF